MYHIFLAIALNLAHPQIQEAQKQFEQQKQLYSKPTQLTKIAKNQTEQTPSEDVINQLKQQLDAEDQALKPDLESLGLDPIDGKTSPVLSDNKNAFATSAQTKKQTGTNEENNSDFLTASSNNSNDDKKEEAKNDHLSEQKLTDITDGKNKDGTTTTDIAANDQTKSTEQQDLLTKAITKIQEIKEIIAKNKIAEPTQPTTEQVAIIPPSKITDDQITTKEKDQIKAKKFEQDQTREKIKLTKLEELRKKYIENNEEDETSGNLSRYQAISKIVPAQKILPKFVSEDVPPPLLNRFRGPDNIHHPIIMSYSEKIDFAFKAIAQNRIDDFNALLNLISDPNIKNIYGDTFLTFAVLMRKYDAISSLLAKGSNPDLANNLGYTPLNIAIELADYKSASLLIDMGANTGHIDELGRTYLMQSSRVGSLQITDLLINKGLNVNITDNNGVTALAIAYKHKKDVIAKFLLKNGAKSLIKKNYIDNDTSMISELFDKWK